MDVNNNKELPPHTNSTMNEMVNNMTYNLKSVSLIPLVVELGIELQSQQLGDELRGGLLSPRPNGWTPLQQIICYHIKNNEDIELRDDFFSTELRDDCFSTVRNWMMRDNNLFVTEDIQQYSLVAKLCSMEFFSEDRLRYLIDMDPVTLSLPCRPEQGNLLPIHWSTEQEDILVFSSVLKAGMKYYPEKFGFVFCDGTHQFNNGKSYQFTPFQRACKKYGQEQVVNEVINRIMEYCASATSASTSRSTAVNNNTISTTETLLLVSAITDASIHVDCLYILLRKDPEAAFALLRLQQNVVLSAAEVVIPTAAVANVPVEEGAAVAAITVPVASNNNNDNNNNASSLISTTDTPVVVSSTTTNHSNNNNDDDDNDHHPSLSSSSSINRKKRK